MSLDSLAPVLVRIVFELYSKRAVGIQGLGAGPADGAAHAGFTFDFTAQDELLAVHSGREDEGRLPDLSGVRVPGIERTAQAELAVEALESRAQHAGNSGDAAVCESDDDLRGSI